MNRTYSFTIMIALAAMLVFTVTACKKEDLELKFDHQLHVVDNELECSQCHTPAEDGGMGSPTMDKCAECHDIDVDNPSEECLQCHTVKSAKNDYAIEKSAPEKPKGYRDLIFSHEPHEDVECSTCHGKISKLTELADIEWPDMFKCKQCHNGDEAPIECEVCHKVVRKEIPPESHHGDWAMHHGLASRTDRSCQFCHDSEKRFCQECHQTQKPRDHIFNWKTTQHGQDATHNRRLCAVCHNSSFCVDCHRTKRPISHARGDWMAFTRENGHAEEARLNFRSCNVCHTTEECSKCHQRIILRK